MSWDLSLKAASPPDPAGPTTNGPPKQSRVGIVFQPARTSTLVAALDATVELLHGTEHPCRFCDHKGGAAAGGKGHLAGGAVCPVCSGRAVIQVQPPVVRCAFCRGRGQFPPRSGLTCWVCKGRGIVPVSGLVRTCSDCRGAGRRRTETLYCRRCGGVGVVGAE